MRYGLKESTISAMQEVFGKFPKVERVLLYGSRAKGNFRPGSDIDLVLVAPELSLGQLHHIEMELDDLLLPYQLDIALYHHIDNRELLEHIARVGIDFV
ncbi:nucleotidyltransferase domain-containing protein [Pedobacter deserti]|uniref:nucleotidyltransferase domain-containing protein n=1 Tax=Pedobacter deserti TaxID=2817382 RepID=UPI00210B5842|nr:nucleotidyltransferase domain-containing protein [Pedobacter sp. SYSU D00382]